MTRIGLTLTAILLMALPLFSFSQFVTPDPGSLPFVLDSTCDYFLNLDTDKWMKNNLRVYHYDSKGNLISEEKQSFPSEWWSWGRTNIRYIYDASGHITRKIGYYWDEDIDSWVGRDSSVYTYDASGHITRELLFKWDNDINEWVSIDGSDFKYDTNGEKLESISLRWIPVINYWMGIEKEEFSYNPDGSPSKIALYRWEYGWVVTEIQDYSYDENGNLVLYNHLQYSKELTLTEGRKETWSYDASGNELEYTSYRCESDNSWVPETQRVSTYDSKGNLNVQIENYNYAFTTSDPDNCKWIGEWKEVLSYDSNDYLTEKTNYNWEGQWVLTDKREYYYDEYGLIICSRDLYYENNELTDVQAETWLYDASGNVLKYTNSRNSQMVENTYEKDGRITERIVYYLNPETQEWVSMSRYSAYWSELATMIGPVSEDQSLSVYPNPVNDLLTIEIEQSDHYSLEINSLNGQLLYKRELEGTSHQIDLSSFQKGVYLITIRSKDFVTTKKIIKQ